MLEKSLSEDRRKDIFLALVEAQDGGASVAESRERVAQQFGVSQQEVRQVEREGLDKGWPPL
jgi:DNA-directed RNA polymerase sigma subunit (sigma70/sigma32)